MNNTVTSKLFTPSHLLICASRWVPHIQMSSIPIFFFSFYERYHIWNWKFPFWTEEKFTAFLLDHSLLFPKQFSKSLIWRRDLHSCEFWYVTLFSDLQAADLSKLSSSIWMSIKWLNDNILLPAVVFRVSFYMVLMVFAALKWILILHFSYKSYFPTFQTMQWLLLCVTTKTYWRVPPKKGFNCLGLSVYQFYSQLYTVFSKCIK